MIEHEIKCLLCGKEAQIVEQNYPGYKEPDKLSKNVLQRNKENKICR